MTNRTACLAARAVIGMIALGLLIASSAIANPPVEPLGVNGELIDVPAKIFVPGPQKLPNRVYRVDSASAEMPAAKLKLEPGDLIVAVDSMRFTSMAGFRHALLCSSDNPSFLVYRIRLQRLTIQNIPDPHRRPDPDSRGPRPPDSYLMSIDIRQEFDRRLQP